MLPLGAEFGERFGGGWLSTWAGGISGLGTFGYF